MIHKPRKLPAPKQRPDGKWVVRWRARVRGRWTRPQRTFGTEAAANEFILRELATESARDPRAGAATFAAIAARWLDGKRRKGVSDRTVETYEYAISVAAKHFAGPIKEMTPLDVDDFATWLADSGKADNSVELIWKIFRAVLRHAVRLQALTSDPSYGLDRPQGKERPARYHFLRPEQIAALADALGGLTPYDLLVRFVAYTGLRRTEIQRLRLNSLTLTAPTPVAPGWAGSVRVFGKGDKWRTVPLPGWLAEEVHGYLAEHPNRADPASPLWPATAKDGTIVWSRGINATVFYNGPFSRAVKRAGLPESMVLHDLRHTYASLLAAQGVRVEQVASLMGHSSSIVTRRVYIHLWPEHLTDAVASLAAPPVAPTPVVAEAPPTNVVPLRPTGS